MRISFFLPRCTSDNSHGRYVIELTKRLSRDHMVTVHAGAFGPSLGSGVRRRFVPVPNRPAVVRLATLWVASMFGARREPADVIHVQGADSPVGNVVTAHFCCAVMRDASRQGGGLVTRFNNSVGAIAEKYSMSKLSTSRVIAVSRQVKSDIEREYGVNPRRIVVIPHGVDLEEFHPSGKTRWWGSVRKDLGIGAEEFVVLFIGGDYRRKGLLRLLEAVARLRAPLRVLAVGVRPDAELVRFMRGSALNLPAIFHGTTAHLAPLFSAADCFALPSRYDTFSMTTLEAMASGLPVIVSRSAGVSELLTSGRDCLLLEDTEDVDTLTSLLWRLVQDEPLRSRLGSQARITAERYSWDETADRTLQVYREALLDVS